MNFSKLLVIVEDRGAWHAVSMGIKADSWAPISQVTCEHCCSGSAVHRRRSASRECQASTRG